MNEVEELISPIIHPEPVGVDVHLHSAENFSRLYTHRHLVVYRYVYGLLGGPAQEVEDLAAETFERAWRARHNFHGDEDAALGWLLKIARRLVIDAYRRHRTRGVDEALDETVGFLISENMPETKALEREQKRILWKLLHELPANQRELLALRYLLGWRVNQMACYLQLTEDTVSARLRRVLIRLRHDWPQPE